MEVVNILRSLDLKTVDIDTIIDYINKTNEQFIIVNKLSKGTKLIRARIWNEIPKIPVNISELSYNPTPSEKFGRANCIGDIIFYASLNLDDSLVPDYMNVLLETINHNDKYIDRKYFALSSWIVKKDLSIVLLGSSLKHSKKTQNKRDYYLDSIVDLPQDFKEKSLIFDDFFSNEFSKVVVNDSDFEYKLSAAYSKFIFNYNIDGIIYNSVASNGACSNIALKKNIIDNKSVEADHVLYGTLYKRDSTYINEYDMRSKEITKDGTIVWEELYGLKYKLDVKVKNYYLGKIDSNPNVLDNEITLLD